MCSFYTIPPNPKPVDVDAAGAAEPPNENAAGAVPVVWNCILLLYYDCWNISFSLNRHNDRLAYNLPEDDPKLRPPAAGVVVVADAPPPNENVGVAPVAGAGLAPNAGAAPKENAPPVPGAVPLPKLPKPDIFSLNFVQ